MTMFLHKRAAVFLHINGSSRGNNLLPDFSAETVRLPKQLWSNFKETLEDSFYPKIKGEKGLIE